MHLLQSVEASMTPPALHDIRQTSEKVRMSVSWLYRHADELHVTRMGNRLFWTDEAIAQVIAERTDATPTAKKATKAREQRKQANTKKSAPKAKPAAGDIPQARPDRARRLRQMEAAA